MYDVLTDTFNYNLNNYGINITVENRTVKALFKLKSNTGMASSKSKDQYLTIFTSYADNIQQGEEIILNGKHYLALKDNSDENTVYNKTFCIDCNQVIKYELRRKDDTTKADLTSFYASADNLSSSVNITDGITTLQSTCHFSLQLNDLSKRINLNERFFSGQNKTGVWRIRDINYQNGFCELYCIRDLIKDTDDTQNMIADRWKFESKPNVYDIAISPANFTINEGSTQQLTIVVKKDNTVVSPTPEIDYAISDSSIIAVDSTSNIATGLKAGTATITGSYKEADNDIVNTVGVVATVNTKKAVGDIVVNPEYSNGFSYYSVRQHYDATVFTANLSGVDTPQWNIVLDANGNAATNYTVTIDNTAGTFSVACNKISSNILKFNIYENTSGKTLEYDVKLVSMMG